MDLLASSLLFSSLLRFLFPFLGSPFQAAGASLQPLLFQHPLILACFAHQTHWLSPGQSICVFWMHTEASKPR